MMMIITSETMVGYIPCEKLYSHPSLGSQLLVGHDDESSISSPSFPS